MIKNMGMASRHLMTEDVIKDNGKMEYNMGKVSLCFVVGPKRSGYGIWESFRNEYLIILK